MLPPKDGTQNEFLFINYEVTVSLNSAYIVRRTGMKSIVGCTIMGMKNKG